MAAGPAASAARMPPIDTACHATRADLGCTPEALLAGHEARGHPREEHREPREDERDHGLNGDRRARDLIAGPSETDVGGEADRGGVSGGG